MATQRPKIKFTYIDYKNTPEDKRYELLDGELAVVPSPRTDHQRTLRKLGVRLEAFVEERGLGEIFFAPFDVVLSDTDVVQPDILFVSNERAGIVTEDNVQGAPDLVVEILSPSTAERDRTFKRSLYAQHGVREFWIVDTNAGRVEILTLGEQGFTLTATYNRDGELTSPVLEGLRIKLNEVF